jgi:hypothetical protein
MCVRAVMDEQTREAHSEVCARFALTLTFVDFQPRSVLYYKADVVIHMTMCAKTALIYDDDGGDDAKKF